MTTLRHVHVSFKGALMQIVESLEELRYLTTLTNEDIFFLQNIFTDRHLHALLAVGLIILIDIVINMMLQKVPLLLITLICCNMMNVTRRF